MRWMKRDAPANGKTSKKAPTRRKPSPRWVRRSGRGLLVAGLFAAAFGGPAWLWQSGWISGAARDVMDAVAKSLAGAGLRVEAVYLQGRHYESAKRIADALAIKRGDPMVAVDLDAARQRLEKLSWVRAASVERRYPDTIRVRIVERQPLALWQRHNELVLVGDRGMVITREGLGRFRDLLVVVGPDAPAHVAKLLEILAHEPDLGRRVNAAVRIGKRRWNIRMNNGVYIRLPEKNPTAAWSRFARLERQHGLLKQNLLSIDLRVPDQLIVRTRSEHPAPAHHARGRRGKNT